MGDGLVQGQAGELRSGREPRRGQRPPVEQPQAVERPEAQGHDGHRLQDGVRGDQADRRQPVQEAAGGRLRHRPPRRQPLLYPLPQVLPQSFGQGELLQPRCERSQFRQFRPALRAALHVSLQLSRLALFQFAVGVGR